MLSTFATEAKAPHGGLMNRHSRAVNQAEVQKKQRAITIAAQAFKLLIWLSVSLTHPGEGRCFLYIFMNLAMHPSVLQVAADL